MNIGINGYEAVVPRFGFDKSSKLPIRVGSSEYVFQLLKNLEKIDKKNNYFIYFPIAPSEDLPKKSEKWNYVVFSVKKMWTLIGLSKKLFKNENKVSVFFSPTHYAPLFAPNLVISILDVSYHYYPGLFKKKDLYKLKLWGAYSIKKAKKILTISEASKNDIIKKYNVASDKVEVIYPGIKQVKSSLQFGGQAKLKVESMKELGEKFGIKNKYILFVGTIQPRKNITRLIEAYSKLDTNVDLVIIGKKGWQYGEILTAPEKFGVKEKIRFIHNVADEDLPSFYKNAQFFILPSLYEGFGLPILEAMQNDCPVITSNKSSLPEAGGNAALYVDPGNVDDIREKMQKLLDDKNLREDLVEKGKIQVEKFSWERSAKQTLKVLESVVKS